MALRLLIVDDHELMRYGLRWFLRHDPGVVIVGEAGDSETAWTAVGNLQPDVVLLDLDIPGEGGVALTRRIQSSFPRIKTIILTGATDPRLRREALEAGAIDFLLKANSNDELFTALTTALASKVRSGGNAPSAPLRASGSPRHPDEPRLSGREAQVLQFVVAGWRNKEIADKLNLGIKSIETYRARLMRKLACTTPADLVRHAIRTGLVQA